MATTAETNEEYSKRLIKEISTGNKEMALRLIAEGSPEQIFSPDKFHKTPLQFAIVVGAEEIALTIINKEGVTQEQLLHKEKLFGNTAMDLAVTKNMKDVAQALSEKTGVQIPDKKDASKKFSHTIKQQPVQFRLDFRDRNTCPTLHR